MKPIASGLTGIPEPGAMKAEQALQVLESLPNSVGFEEPLFLGSRKLQRV